MTTFTVTASDLSDAAAWAARIIPSRPMQPILGGLLLEAGDDLTISAYDYETSVSVSIPATTTVPGRVLVSGRLLADIAKTIKGDTNVTIVADGPSVQVQAGRSEWSLPALPVEDYPALPQLGEPAGVINAGVLRRAVSRVQPAAGKDDTLPMLTGIKVEASHDMFTLTATDRFRIATATVDWDADGQAVLDVLAPASLLDVAARALRADSETVAIYQGGGSIGWATDTHQIIGRLLDVAFPRWQQLMVHDPEHYAVVEVAELARAADQALVVAGRIQQVVLEFEPSVVVVTAAGDDNRARADAPVLELAGDPMTVAVNAGYLRDALAAAGSDRVRIHFGASSTKPLMFAPVDDATYRHLLMPVRLPAAERAA